MDAHVDFDLGLIRVAGVGGGARLDMAICTPACDDGFACPRALSSGEAAQTQPSPLMGRKLVSGHGRVDNNSIYSGAESGGLFG